ncbi:MAG: cytochrome c oxidase subunit II [Proteobacteria bacterium]|nr:cytochrome c oxidase subunit II [Pseudomonadota bacterium]
MITRFVSLVAALMLAATQVAIATEMKFDGLAHPLGFQTPNSSVATTIAETYDFIFWITVVIGLLVEGVLLYAIFRFRRSSKRGVEKAKKFSHNTPLEIVWTIIPVIICLAITWKAYEALFYLKRMPEKGMTVEAIAYQFNWDFRYPDLGITGAEADKPHAELSSAGVERYVKDLVVPVGANIKMDVTAVDVLHAFFVPSMGVKVDAIPGRVNHVWFNAERPGDYIGQCAELCGGAHGEMFFNVKVLDKADWVKWVNTRRVESGLQPMPAAEIATVMGTTL